MKYTAATTRHSGKAFKRSIKRGLDVNAFNAVTAILGDTATHAGLFRTDPESKLTCAMHFHLSSMKLRQQPPLPPGRPTTDKETLIINNLKKQKIMRKKTFPTRLGRQASR